EVVLLAEGAEVLPPKPEIQGKVGRGPIVVLHEEAEAVVEGGPLGVPLIDRDKRGEGHIELAAGVEIHQRVHNGIGIEPVPGGELEDTTFQVVVEVVDSGAPEFSAELKGVAAMEPG